MSWRAPSWRRVLQRTLLTLTLTSLVCVALLTSNVALRMLTAVANTTVDGVHIEGVEGDLIHGVTLDKVHLATPSVQLDVAQLQLRWRPSCLPAICIDAVQIHQVTLAQLDAATPEAEPARQSAPLWPSWLALEIPDIHVDTINLALAAGQLKITTLTTGVRLSASTALELSAVWQPTQLAQLHWQSSPTAPASDLDLGATLKHQLTQWPAWQVELSSLELQQLVLDQHRITEVAVSATLEPERLTLKRLQLQWQDVQLQASSLLTTQGALQGQLTTRAANTPPSTLRWQGDLAALQFTGDVRLHQQTISDSLGLSGAFSVQAMVDLLQRQPAVDLELQSPQVELYSATQPATPPAPSTPAVTEPPAYINALQLHYQGHASKGQLTLAAQTQWPGLPTATVSFTGLWQQATLSVKEFTIATLNGHVALQGELNATELRAHVAATNIQPGLFWTDFPGQVSGESDLLVQLKPQLALTFSNQEWQGSIRALPFTLTGDLAVWFEQHWRLKTDGITLSHGKNQIQLSGALEQQWQLALHADVPDFNTSLPMAEGRLQADIIVAGPYKTPNVQLDLTGSELAFGDDLALASIVFRGIIRQFGDLSSELTLNVKGLTSPSLQIRALAWHTNGTLAAHQSELTLDSPQLKAQSQFRAGWQQQRWSGQFSQMDLTSDLGHWVLDSELQLVIAPNEQTIKLSDSCFVEQTSRVCLHSSDWLSLNAGTLRLEGSQVALQNFDWLLPGQLGIAGRADGYLDLRWQQRTLQQAAWQIDAHDGQIRYQGYSPIELPWQQLAVQGQLAKNRLQQTLQLQLNEQDTLKLSADLRELDKAKPQINATLSISQLNLNFLQPLFNEFSKFSGQLRGALALSGDATFPDIRGELRVEQLAITGSAAPLELNPSTLVVRWLGRQATIAADLVTSDGPLTLEANANWVMPDAWYAQSRLSADLLTLQTSYGDLSIKPQLQLLADAKGGSVSGTLEVPKGQLQFNDLPEDAVRVSTDEVMLENRQQAQKSDWRLNSDVRLILGNQVKFAAFGLKTRLQGELRVRQQNNLPTIHGQVNLHDGVFRAYGQDLQLTKGRLTFNGLPQQPLLAIEAVRNKEKTEDNVIAGIRVNGTADDPTVEVFSKPSKPQANALAYLLLGRDIGTSQGDGAMTTGLIGLGIASSGKLVGRLGEAFGVSDLALDTAGSGDASKVTVSGYLSPKLQVKYGVGIFNQLGEFTLRYRIVKQLYLEAVRGLDNSIDLLYKVEFD